MAGRAGASAMMKLPSRHPQWEARLDKTVRRWSPREHQPRWGHDCAAFVLLCVKAVAGESLTFEVTRYRSVAGQGRALRQLGWKSLLNGADACLGDRIPPLAVHRGDIVSDGAILGVMTSNGPVAFGENGMVPMRRDSIVAAWPVGRSDG